VAHHRAGRRQAAEQAYRQALEAAPHQPDALHGLGDLAYQGGHCLGNALKEQQKLDEACACYRRALELDPDDAEAHSAALTISPPLAVRVSAVRNGFFFAPPGAAL
jgi:tetratricopeptide (TPR) repeat protein